tara:strand:- start:71 stop:493 length:423 start_codon:yes stop_codon:yes gene_type:complete
MGLFGGGGEEELAAIEKQIEDIERFQDSQRPSVGEGGNLPTGLNMQDLESGVALDPIGSRVSPFRTPGAERLNLAQLLRAAQAPVEGASIAGMAPEMAEQPGLGVDQQRGPGEYEELMSQLRQLGGMQDARSRQSLVGGI